MGLNRYLRALIKRWGTTRSKGRVWDKEYGGGHWNVSVPSATDAPRPRNQVYEVVEKYARGGAILDLGCGTGLVAAETCRSYREYVGVDISAAAIRFAEAELTKCPELCSKASFRVDDISRFTPTVNFSVILFGEVLYYFPKGRIRALLRHHSRFLSGDGVLIARLHDRRRYRHILEIIDSEWRVIEVRTPSHGTSATVVFRPARPLEQIGNGN